MGMTAFSVTDLGNSKAKGVRLRWLTLILLSLGLLGCLQVAIGSAWSPPVRIWISP